MRRQRLRFAVIAVTVVVGGLAATGASDAFVKTVTGKVTVGTHRTPVAGLDLDSGSYVVYGSLKLSQSATTTPTRGTATAASSDSARPWARRR